MAIASEPAATNLQPAGAAAKPRKRERDIRLDFFRGLGMFIILIAHIPDNTWTNWIFPAKFGFADATEIFVFCSGAASAIAFLAVYNNKGWWIGTTRIIWRIWQIYWCHIGVFFTVLAVLYFWDNQFALGGRYINDLNFRGFTDAPEARLFALMTLTYVPNYFDILVMYIVILALVPIMAALARFNPMYAMAFSVGLYLLASQPWLAFIDVPKLTFLSLPAEPWSDRSWFFNPFAWQLVFFTGFAFSAGWLPAPPIRRSLMIAAGVLLFVVFWFDPDGVPVMRIGKNVEWVADMRTWYLGWSIPDGTRPWSTPLHDKTTVGVLRFLQFLALAYLVWALAGDKGKNLPSEGVAGRAVLVVRRVGQQSLAVFIASLPIAQSLRVYLVENGQYDMGVNATINLVGFAAIILVAYVARYFRSQPWSTR